MPFSRSKMSNGGLASDNQGDDQPIVAISTSEDAELGALSAPLGADLSLEQVARVVWRALDLDTSPRNLRAIVRPGDWVVVKPNIVTSRSNRESSYWDQGRPHRGQNTDLRVVKAVVEYLLEHCQPGRISIAEGGAEWWRVGEPDTPAGVTEDGWTVHWPEFGNLSYADLVSGWQATRPGLVDIVDLNYGEFRFLPVPDPAGSGIGALQRRGAERRPIDRYGRDSFVAGTGTLRTGYWVPATVVDCDVLISCAAFKTHLASGTSLSIKNYVGTMEPNRQRRNFKSVAHEGEINAGFVDAFAYHPAEYAVVEGFWGTEGNGPQWGDDVQHNIVVAGSDPVAVDTVCSVIMGYNPEDLEYLQLARRKRLGEADLRRIQVVGKSIDAVQRPYYMGQGRSGVVYTGRGVRQWLVASADDETRESVWTRIESPDRYVDLVYHLGHHAPAVVWAYTEVECDRPLTPQLWLGADGPAELYREGELVQRLEPADGHCLGEARIALPLPAGRTGLLLKVRRGSQGFGFSVLLCGQPGCLPLGVHYLAPEEPKVTVARQPRA